MARLPLLGSLIVIILVQVHGQAIELNPDNIDSLVTSGKWLVEFYAPWCGYCRKIESTYNQVAISLKDKDVTVAKVDASKYKALAHRFGVEGYPTIIHINEGIIRKYEGERSKDAMISYATTGFEKDKPAFSTLFSPLGFLGRAFGIFLEFVVFFQEGYERARVTLSLSHPVALGLLAAAVIVFGLALGVVLTCFLALVLPGRGPAADPKKSN